MKKQGGKEVTRRILISEDDIDDQFILKTAIAEIDPQAEIRFFYSSVLLSQYLVKISIENKEEEPQPDMIIGDLKAPFFELKDIAALRTFRQFDKIPIYVFAESYLEINEAEALDFGATRFFHKPSSLTDLKRIFTEIFKEDKNLSVATN